MNPIQPNYGDMAVQFSGAQHTVTNANDVVTLLLAFGNVAIYLLVAAAVVYIVYFVVRYLVAQSDPSGKREALVNVGWGILGLAIIMSLWGLVNIVVNSFKTNSANVPNLPSADFVKQNR